MGKSYEVGGGGGKACLTNISFSIYIFMHLSLHCSNMTIKS